MSVRFSSLKLGLSGFKPGTVSSTDQHSTNFTNNLNVFGFRFPLYKLHYPNTYLRKYMTFKEVKQLNLIGAMKTFTKPNQNLCMEERLTILKKLRDKRVTIMKNYNINICLNKIQREFFDKNSYKAKYKSTQRIRIWCKESRSLTIE